MTRTYRLVYRMALAIIGLALALILLAALGVVDGLRLAGMSLWPAVIVAAFASVFVASWAYARSKGCSGWIGLLAPLLDVFGLKLLQRLENRTRTRGATTLR